MRQWREAALLLRSAVEAGLEGVAVLSPAGVWPPDPKRLPS